MADVQGSSLCLGSTPGTLLLPFRLLRGILYSGIQEREVGEKI